MVNGYDYVIVGAGTAGCVLANRLTERDAEVLLLEAGAPDEKEAIHVPKKVGSLSRSAVDWNYTIEPQSELEGRTMPWPRGKVLGGSSAINSMVHVRGNPWDFDHWAALGNEGWSYEDLLPYFKRSEHFEPDGDPAYHGTGGPLNIALGSEPHEVSKRLVDAAVEVGFERNDDFNGARQEGAGFFHVTIKDGTRHSGAAAYVKPVLERPNLTVETRAHVTRVLFDGDRATGVEYERGGDRHRADAAAEVLLAAGAVNSPQLLLLSGVGPAAHLAENDIEVTADLPGVGRNLQDHLFASASYTSTEPIELPPESNIGEAGAFERSEPDVPAPDLQYHLTPSLGPGNLDDGFSIDAIQLRPESRGRITLRSADPFADPVIDPQYLTAEEDVEKLIYGVKRAREIGQADAVAPYRDEEIRPGPEVQTDAEIEEYVRENARTVAHPVGTCKMGDDDMAVVDERLRVRGLEGLRVVDASIMPTITSGNTNAPTVAIAEKGADMIAADR